MLYSDNVSKKQAASIVGVSEATLENLVKKENFPKPFKIGGRWYHSESEINSWVNDKKANGYKRILIGGVRHYGQHMMLTANGCNAAIEDIDCVSKFLSDLVLYIDMVAYGKPLVARFGDGIEIGISGVQLIETSAITIHTNDGSRDMYLDVFSCKQYDEEKVINTVKQFYHPKNIDFQTVFRK